MNNANSSPNHSSEKSAPDIIQDMLASAAKLYELGLLTDHEVHQFQRMLLVSESRLESDVVDAILVDSTNAREQETQSGAQRLHAIQPGPAEPHALDRDYPPQPPPFTTQTHAITRRALGDVLQQFLSEKNIHWGELLSAFLIVGSAVGLILSLRTELSRLIPMFPAVLFSLITVAIHVAGFYTLQRWKLPSTSRGLLFLGTFMIPISALATSLLLKDEAASGLLSQAFLIPAIVGGIGLGSLAYFAGRQLYSGVAVAWSFPPILAGVSILATRHCPEVGRSESVFLALAAAALSPLFATALTFTFSQWIESRANRKVLSHEQFRLLGSSAFAVIVAVAYLLFRAPIRFDQPLQLAIPSSLLGILGCWIGGYFSNRLQASDSVDGRPSTDMPHVVRLLGTSISILGGLGFLAGLLAAHSDFDRFQQVVLIGLASSVVFAMVLRQIPFAATALFLAHLAIWLQAIRMAGLASTEGITSRWLFSVIPSVTTAWTATLLALGSSLFSWLVRDRVEGSADTRRAGEPISNLRQTRSLSSEVSLEAIGQLAAIVQVIIAFGIAVYFGMLSNSDSEITTSIAILAITVLVTAAHARRSANPGMFASFGLTLLFLLFVLVRPDTYVERIFGFTEWEWWPRAILLTCLYATTCCGMFQFLAWIPKRYPKSQELDVRLLTSWLGILVGLLAVFLIIIRTDPAHWMSSVRWLAWISPLLTAHFFSRSRSGNHLEMVDGSPSPTLGLAAQSTIFFAMLFAIAETIRAAAPPIDFRLAFSIATTLVLIASTAMACFGKRLGHWSFFGGWRTVLGDVAFLVYFVYQQISIWTASLSWGRTVQLGLHGDAIAWTCLFTALIIALVVMTVSRASRFYIWIAGLYCSVTTAQLLVMWFPSGDDLSALFYLTTSAPLALSIGLGIASLLQSRRLARTTEGETEGKAYPFRVEAFDHTLLVGTTLLWCLISFAVWFQRLSYETSDVWGLATPYGGLWVAIMGTFLAIQRMLVRNILQTIFGNLAALCVCLHLPILIERVFSFRFPMTTLPSILLFAMGAYVFLASLLPLLLRRWKIIQEETSELHMEELFLSSRREWHGIFAEAIASITLFGCAVLGVGTREGDSLRIIALASTCSGLGLWFLGLNQSRSPVRERKREQLQQRLQFGAFAIAIILFSWSSIDPSNWSSIWTSRSLRITLLGLLLSIGISIYYALSKQFDQNEESPGSLLDRIRFADPSLDRECDLGELLSRLWMLCSSVAVIGIIIDIVLVRQILSSNDFVRGDASIRQIDGEVLACVLLSVVWLPLMIVQALRSEWNIARLQESSKSSYVFLAEFMVCSSAILLYSIRPHWFDLPFRTYWPIIMLAIAVVFQGIGQLLQRSGVESLSTPMRSTGLALPIAAAVGLFFFTTIADPELILLLGGIFYFVMGGAGESRRWAILGSVFGNAALLLFWNRYEMFQFSKHPQLWLVPPAVSVLVATHFEKKSFPDTVLNWVRYLAVATIFLSSSTEILVQGLGKQLWPPMILMSLSVLAVLLGIGFRVRSYLFSGVLFLLVAMFAMVSHAQQSLQHTWPWWAFGISLGVGILVLFGWFEKRREDLHQIASKLKEWEA